MVGEGRYPNICVFVFCVFALSIRSSAGNVFLRARSPDAPKIVIVCCFFSSSAITSLVVGVGEWSVEEGSGSGSGNEWRVAERYGVLDGMYSVCDNSIDLPYSTRTRLCVLARLPTIQYTTHLPHVFSHRVHHTTPHNKTKWQT